MDKSQMIKAAEAVLFASGEPISKERLSSFFESLIDAWYFLTKVYINDNIKMINPANIIKKG